MAKAEVSRIKHISFNNPTRLFNEELDPNIFQFDTIINPDEKPLSSSKVKDSKNNSNNVDDISVVDTSFNFLKRNSAKQNQFFLEKTPKESSKGSIKNTADQTINNLFNTDRQNVIGAMRVLQKSVTFMIFSMLSFGGLTFVASNLFSLSSNPFSAFGIGILASIVYIAVTNLFFIIVADRSYIWLMLIVQAILLIAITIIAGGNTSLILGGVIILSSLMYYLSYLELEKAQLGSRLFNLSSIVGEPIRLLGTLAVIIICFGIMTQVISRGTVKGEFQGAENFVNEVFLSNKSLVDGALIGTWAGGNNGRAFGFNSLFMNKSLSFRSGKLLKSDGETATLRDFLTLNYKPGELLLTDKQKGDLESQCSREKNANCDQFIADSKDKKLEAWQSEAYTNLGNQTLNTQINSDVYKSLTKDFYFNQIHSWSTDKGESSSKLSVPLISNFSPRYILPSIIVFAIFAVLMILKPLYSFLAYLLTWVFWQALKALGFARIEVETVESEVVSI